MKHASTPSYMIYGDPPPNFTARTDKIFKWITSNELYLFENSGEAAIHPER